MFEIRWIQNDSTIIKRQLPDALGSMSVLLVLQLNLHIVAYNEDSQLQFGFYEPLHLEVRFELWETSFILP